jgi:uncharacterized metal-binding protein
MINLVICGGYSPQARVLRSAARGVAKCGEVQVITLCPALAGLANRVEEVRSLDPQATVVVDACEGGCALQALQLFGVKPRLSILLTKYPVFSEKYVVAAREKIVQLLAEVGGQ